MIPIIFLSLITCIVAQNPANVFDIRGQVLFRKDMPVPKNWKTNSRVLVNYGEYIGFIKDDGSFIVEGVPSGSYIVEVTNVDYIFEPIRYEINSKGKARARQLNLLQPNNVEVLPIPLVITARQPTRYFRIREEWKVTDVLLNPMVLMLLVAMVLLFLTPRLAGQDPELQKEMEKMQMPKMDVPDVAEVFANMFGGGKKTTKKPAVTRS
uniref:ER membrane protein complex subunit 7 beta-sandwich domain-containing protein n=1 Tax=Panagrolaimus sp. JU765 TaxID=591449 RepID=A0AC34PW65_9BILA